MRGGAGGDLHSSAPVRSLTGALGLFEDWLMHSMLIISCVPLVSEHGAPLSCCSGVSGLPVVVESKRSMPLSGLLCSTEVQLTVKHKSLQLHSG